MDKDNAPFLDMENNQNPEPHFKARYGNQHVPLPCNHKAEEVDASAVMEAVLQAE